MMMSLDESKPYYWVEDRGEVARVYSGTHRTACFEARGANAVEAATAWANKLEAMRDRLIELGKIQP